GAAPSHAPGRELAVVPVRMMRSFHAALTESRSRFIFSIDSGRPYSSQLATVRPVGCNMLIRTYLPLTVGSHALNSVESATSASTTTSPSTACPLVVGLQAN